MVSTQVMGSVGILPAAFRILRDALDVFPARLRLKCYYPVKICTLLPISL